MYKKRQQSSRKSRKDWIDETTYGYQGKPNGETTIKEHLSVKALKDLPHSSYALRSDPYAAALPTSEPYPILNKFNKVVGGDYGGEDNLDGGNVQQYANSTTSNFLKAFDCMRLKVNNNYRYLPINPKFKISVTSTNDLEININNETYIQKTVTQIGSSGRYYQYGEITFTKAAGSWQVGGNNVTLSDYGITITGTVATGDVFKVNVEQVYAGIQLIDEMRKSIAESVSILQATTFTQMAINNFAIDTDMPMGNATRVNCKQAGQSDIYLYTDLTDVLYGMSIYYQLVLQDALSVMNWHNSFRLKQGTMIRNAWNREVPSLNAFFGLMNKKAFLSMLDSINLSFEGEYIDKEYMTQMNMLTLVPSRRSNSISDPVLELQCGWNRPSYFKVYLLDNNGSVVSYTPFFNDEDMKLNINYNGVAQDVSFWKACDHLRDMLSMEETQLWARSSFTPAGITGTDNARYNQIKYLFDVIVASFTLFKPMWSDFREAFDVMARTGTISWTKGFRPSVVKDTDVALFWNVTVDHIYQFILSGAHELNYDDATKRWRTFSLWNMYSGIPIYDQKSGGAFLTLSFKEFGSGAGNAEQFEYLPLLFEPYRVNNEIKCVALSRDGLEAVIDQYSTNIQNNVVLNRLAPLVSQSSLEIRVPTVSYTPNSSLSAGHFSNLYKTLTQIFGSCRIQSVNNGSYDYALDPDVLSVYQIEINDITNMSITYARANAPFRGTTSKSGDLGFMTIKRG